MSQTYLQHFELVTKSGDVPGAFHVLERVRGRTLAWALEDRNAFSTAESGQTASLETDLAGLQVQLMQTNSPEKREQLMDRLVEYERLLGLAWTKEDAPGHGLPVQPASLSKVQDVLPLEAICAGILELLERDSIRRIDLTSLRRFALDSLPAPAKRLASLFLESGVELSIVSCPSPTRIPAVYCISRDKLFEISTFFCSGSGASTDTDAALIRALTEVAQSRVGFVAALRHDVGAKIKLLL